MTVLSLIAAVDAQGGIGLNNRLLVHLPEDLAHFKRNTLGCPVLMGRLTWESLPPAFRPLPGRRNLVLSRKAGFSAPGAEVVNSLEQALHRLSEAPKAFVIGGAQLYALALPLAQELVLTEIEAHFPADAHFPAWNRQDFEETSRTRPQGPSPVPYSFVTYRRRQPPAKEGARS